MYVSFLFGEPFFENFELGQVNDIVDSVNEAVSEDPRSIYNLNVEQGIGQAPLSTSDHGTSDVNIYLNCLRKYRL